MVFLSVLTLIIPAVWALVTPGFFEPHDLHHLADIFEMFRSLGSGQIPPRWAPDFSYGFGYPLFNYYYLLPFYIGAGFYSILGSLTESLKLLFLFTFLISAYGMYKFLREFTGKLASLVGSVLFVYTPYRAVQIYVRGAVGEALALALFPLAGYFLIKSVKNPSFKNTAKAGLFLGIFLLSHNYMWFLSLPFIYLLAAFYIYKNRKALVALVSVTLLGFGAAAFWWVPALMEIKYVPRLTPFLLIDHFPFMKQLVIPSWGYGASHWGPYDDLSFQIGVVNLLVIGVLFLLLLSRFKKLPAKKLYLVLWILGGFGISVVFMNIRTLPIWKLLPFYNFIQFPWRLLYLTTFFTSIAAALSVDLLKNKKHKKILSAIIILGSIGLTFNYFKPSGKVFRNDDHYFNLFFNDPNYSEDYLLLSQWTDKRPTKASSSKFTVESGEILSIRENTPVNWSAEFTANTDTVLTFHTYYFPGWEAEVDGNPVELVPGEPNGQITVSVPPGEHKINISWEETSLRKSMDLLSLTSLLIILYMYNSSRSPLRGKI